MSAYGLLEIAIVGLIVAISAWSVLRPLLRRRKTAGSAGHCGSKNDSCGGCGGCGSAAGNEKPVRFHS